jgi:urease gamma subunit
MASEVLISISRDEVERARLMSEYKGEVDQQSKMVQARRLERAETEARIKNKVANLLKSGKTLEEIMIYCESKSDTN